MYLRVNGLYICTQGKKMINSALYPQQNLLLMSLWYRIAGFYHMDFIFAATFFCSNYINPCDICHMIKSVFDIPAAVCVSYRNLIK